MNSLELESIQAVAKQIESSLKAIEDVLENTNSQPLYLATGCLVDVLKHLHEVDPELLNEESKARIEALLAKQKSKSGRDSFNTGF
jgi:hypothetical protein